MNLNTSPSSSNVQKGREWINKHPILAVVIFLFLLGFLGNLFGGSSDTTSKTEIQQPIAVQNTDIETQNETIPTASTTQTNSQYKYYSVSSVVDGDTIKINIDGTITTLRLIGIDTPETVDPRKSVQCFGTEASNKAKELLSGKKVRIEKDSTQGDLDKYGRTLAYVYREDGLFFNKYMIEQGYAHEYTYSTPYKYQAEFKVAQKSAQENLMGLWSPNTCNGDTTSSATTSSPTTTTTTTTTQTNTTNSSTGKYYTSSASNASKYYPEACSAWQSLSKANLKSFNSLNELLAVYPNRTIAKACE